MAAGTTPEAGAWLEGGWLREALRCPVTGGELEDRRDAGGVLVGLVSRRADPPLAYPVRDGVPVLLADEAVPEAAAAPPAEGE